MKLSVVNTVVGILSGMKLNRISDKEVKNALVFDYLNLRKEMKEINSYTQEIVNKFQEDWKDTIAIIRKLRQDNEPIEGYEEYLSSEQDANETIAEYLNGETDVEIKTVSVDAFVNSLGDEELSFEQIAFLQDCGLIS